MYAITASAKKMMTQMQNRPSSDKRYFLDVGAGAGLADTAAIASSLGR